MKHFNKNEFADYDKMDKKFLKWLDDLREEYGRPMRINSSYRAPKHNAAVGGVSNSAHTEVPCKAVDIHCDNSRDRYLLVLLAAGMGCERIGIGENFVHLDLSTNKPGKVLWHYYK